MDACLLEQYAKAEFKLTLPIQLVDDRIFIRDLYALMRWDPEIPRDPTVRAKPGTYRIELISRLPESGVIGDDQVIDLFFEPQADVSTIEVDGVPELCF